MRLTNGSDDREVERLLAGRIPAGAAPELEPVANFVRALGAAVLEAPDPARGAALVTRLAETAKRGPTESASRETRPRRRGRLTLALRLGIAAALVPALAATLAVAGVELPDPAQEAFEKVGISLPNQAEENARSDQAPASENAGGQGSQGSEESGTTTGAAEPRAKRKAYGPDRANRQDPPGEAVRRGPNPEPGTPRGKPDQLPGPSRPEAASPPGKALDRGQATDGIERGEAPEPPGAQSSNSA